MSKTFYTGLVEHHLRLVGQSNHLHNDQQRITKEWLNNLFERDREFICTMFGNKWVDVKHLLEQGDNYRRLNNLERDLAEKLQLV